MFYNTESGVKMFSKGDIVLYSSNGVCKITEITTKKIAGMKMEYYVLNPVFSSSSTLFVPTGNDSLVNKMRYVLSSDEINSVIKNNSCVFEWIEDKNLRFENFKSIISKGDFEELVSLVRILRNHEKQQIENGKHLHISDERFLKEAEKMVSEEIAVALNVERDDAVSMIVLQ